jgi:N-acetylneuraminic acid mutarotase
MPQLPLMQNNTITRLANGNLLSIGGSYGSNYFGDIILFDYKTNLWKKLGSLGIPRSNHTSTLLSDGRILVVGGTAGYALNSVEIVDIESSPLATAIATFGFAVSGHKSVLLDNGKVLVCGGYDSPNYYNFCYLYNPSNSWASTGSMGSNRSLFSLVKLQDGNVFAIGGTNGSALSSSEIYYVNTGAWDATLNQSSTLRYFNTATLLNNGKVLVAGGANHSNYLSSAIIYDPDLNTWSSASSMNYARAFHTANLLPDGRVLVVGGSDSINTTAIGRSAEIYNPDTDTWTLISNLNLERRNHNTVVLSDGRAIIVGGEFQSFYHPSFDIFSIYSPVALKISNGVAPFTNFINGAAIANTLAFDTSTRLLFPTSNKSTGIYLQDSNLIRSNEAIITVNP